jgi:hypothetical protein
MLDWLTDLLLESPAPPANWVPSRAQRLADARITLRRRFGLARGTAGRRPHYLHDLNRVHGVFGSSRVVSGAEIEADLESDITSINPPIMQGWILGATLVAGWLALVGMADLGAPGTGRAGWLLIGQGLAGWLILVCSVAWVQRVIDLDDDGVHVRRWTDVWLRRQGRLLGPPSLVTARLDSPSQLIIEGPGERCRLRLWLWPASARADLVDELPAWGVDCTFERHRHRPRHDRRSRRREGQMGLLSTSRMNAAPESQESIASSTDPGLPSGPTSSA